MLHPEKKEILKRKRDIPSGTAGKRKFKPLQVLKLLCSIIFVLSFISLTVSYIKYVVSPASGNLVNILMTFFYFDKEYNIPTYFSSALLLIAAGLSGYVFLLESWKKAQFYRYWAVLSLGFLFMSVDEYVGFHELLNLRLQESTNLSGWLYYPWVIAGIAVVLVVGLLFYRFLLNLNSHTRKQFFLPGCCMLEEPFVSNL